MSPNTLPPIAVIGVTHELAQLESRVTDPRSQDTPWGRLVVGYWQAGDTAAALAAVAVGKVGAAMVRSRPWP
jgi:hypothetical protein